MTTSMNDRLAAILSRVFKTPQDRIDLETGPHNLPAWDSAGHMNLVLELEKEFNVKFEDDEIIELVSVAAIAEALARHGATP